MENHIQNFIESGLLEAYVTGSASEAEEKEVLYMKNSYPQVKQALNELEIDLEKIAQHMAIAPPPTLWNRIESDFNEITIAPPQTPAKINRDERREQSNESKEPKYIEVEGESTHMRIHKSWKWVFAAVFVLGKIFLGFAIYFYLENRQAQQNIQELRQEIREIKRMNSK
ncbi:hypothetical protein KHS38_04440 [Mucilaginibacter sp. Bleaf8]|uniref:hypothetical protein n=1 Tax=Mucilaginibacter sp. Bleaf8 TaxID=2834430 RepID=UPI001BCFF98E|nr:hypothetical protein [Mucilaginibacter sp. Bleaf8]MBS7563645.1 hypothetical protein [Mucilaginibacter sp. Bleaf8]